MKAIVKWGGWVRGEKAVGTPESGVSGLHGVEMGDIKGGRIVLEFLYLY